MPNHRPVVRAVLCLLAFAISVAPVAHAQGGPLFITSTPPPSASGSPPPSSSGGLSAQVAALTAQVAALTAQASALQTTAAALATSNAELTSQVAALETQVAKLSGQITAGDLAGTYAYVGIQNELVTPSTTRLAQVGAYVFRGTVTLAADGTGSGTITQTGSYLTFFQPSLTTADVGPKTSSFTWSYSIGIVTIVTAIFSEPLSVAAGGRVMTFAGADEMVGSDALIILTRLD